MNDTQITFSGWVGSDVTLTEVTPDRPVASFRVGSTPRRFRAGQWEDGPTAWHTVKAWGVLARHLHACVSSGDPVLVQGRLVADVWQRGDGTTSTRLIVVATTVGHDLSRGTSRFTKTPRREPAAPVDESPIQEVIHSYDESGPRLDADGRVVEEATAPAPEGMEPAA